MFSCSDLNKNSDITNLLYLHTYIRIYIRTYNGMKYFWTDITSNYTEDDIVNRFKEG